MKSEKSWSEIIADWEKQTYMRLVCIIDDEKEYDIITSLANVKVREGTDEYEIYPEERQIIAGTFPTMVSALLNRGYGILKNRAPLRFGILNNHTSWRGSNLPNMNPLHEKFKTFNCNFPKNTNKIPDIGKYFDIDKDMNMEDIAGQSENYKESKRIISDDPLWIKLSDHSSSTANMYKTITKGSMLTQSHIKDGTVAARYHDWGKCHNIFKESFFIDLNTEERKMREKYAWAKRRPRVKTNDKFCHDLVAGAGLMMLGFPFIISWLVITHHGNFRTFMPDVNDFLPSTDLGDGIVTKDVNINVKGSEYKNQFNALYEEYGPFKLGYLESILRAADIRTSKIDTGEVI